jgi:hypothetical protein
MKSLSRRSVIAGSAAAVTAIPAVAIGAEIVASAAEDPELRILGDQIDSLLAAYRQAVQRKQVARAAAETLCPALPDELLVKPEQWHLWASCIIEETDVEGKIVYPPNYVGADGKTYARRTRRILSSELMRNAIAWNNINGDRRTEFGKKVWKLIHLAEAYEAQRSQAIMRSGLERAAEHLCWAAFDLHRHANQMRGLSPRSLTGVVIYARAIAAYKEAEEYPGAAARAFGGELADAVLRVVGPPQPQGH